ncbi:MAG: hypothetical protein M3164_07495 [Actinomycetota bacterium]|nr:hypothetical protein [Actinomycetota bacterium]
MSMAADYGQKRSFTKTPEPPPAVAGDVDPAAATPGRTFVIHQHHARRLHFDLRLEMLNGDVPVLVSWAVPKNLPTRPKEKTLAIHVEDHPFEYGSFRGTIPAGNYGAGEVRIFDSGTYEMLDQKKGKLTFRLEGQRLKGVWHLVQTSRDENENWLAILSEWEGDEPDPLPPLRPMLATAEDSAFDDPEWTFEPLWEGMRAIAVCEKDTKLVRADGAEITPEGKLGKIHDRLVALNAVVDGVIGRAGDAVFYVAFDLLYIDGKTVTEEPLSKRQAALAEGVVPAEFLQVSPSVPATGTAVLAAARQNGLTGIVAKRLSSSYRPGPSSDWRRIDAQ